MVQIMTQTPFSDLVERQAREVKMRQDDLLGATRSVLDGAWSRRLQSMDRLFAVTTESMAAKSPLDVFQTWIRWSQGAMTRLADDAKDSIEIGAITARGLCTLPQAMMPLAGHQNLKMESGPAEHHQPAATNSVNGSLSGYVNGAPHTPGTINGQ